jgi:hypothetical protein
VSFRRQPTLASGAARDNRAPLRVGVPGRGELAGCAARRIHQGGAYKADLFALTTEDGELIVKDYAGKSRLVRRIGSWLVARECAAYGWLAELDGVPELVGRIDAHALALRRVAGRPLDDLACPPPDGAALYRRLIALVDAMHRRGVVHLDLRTRKNVVVGEDRSVWILDLASAIRLRPGGLAHRLLFPWLRLVDRAALLKWKSILRAGEYTAEERRFLRRFHFWRSLWIFHLPSRREAE